MASETENRGREVELDDLLDMPGRERAGTGDAVLLVGEDGRTVLWTNERAARRLGHRDAAGLLSAALPAESPGARRLAELARDPQPAGAGRLEKLRFNAGFRQLLLTALCSSAMLRDGRKGLVISLLPGPLGVAADGLPLGPALTGSALDGIHEATTDAMLRLDLVARRSREMAEGEAPQMPPLPLADGMAEPAMPVPAMAAGEVPAISGDGSPGADIGQAAASEEAAAAAAGAHDPAPVYESPIPAEASAPRLPAWLELAPAERRPVRFTFATGAGGEITRLSPQFGDALGFGLPVQETGLAETIAALDAEAGSRLSAALSRGETFSGIRALLPAADGAWQVPVEFSALPLGGNGGTGFAGFGRIRLDEACESPAPADIPAGLPPDPAPEQADGASASDEWPAEAPAAAGTGPDPEAIGESADPSADHDIAPTAQHAAAAIGEEIQPAETASEAIAAPGGQEEVESALAGTIPETGSELAVPAVEAEESEPESVALPDADIGTDEPADAEAPAPSVIAADAEADEVGDLAADAEEADTAGAPPSESELEPPRGSRRAALAAVPSQPASPPPNVVSIRTGQPTSPVPGFQRQGLSNSERNAFREIARALGARFEEGDGDNPAEPAADHAAEQAQARRDEAGAPAEPPADASPLRRFGRRGADQPPAERAEAPGALLDRIPVGILVLKEDKPLYANATLLDLTGYPDFLTFAAEDGPRAIFRKTILPREAAGIDTVALATRDGELLPVEAHLQLVDWDGGKATLISIRRAVEVEQGRALRTVALDLKRTRGEAGELRAILDTATDGVLTLDGNGNVLSLNGAAEALFGLAQNEVVGESFTRLLVNESHADALDYLDGLKAAGVRSVLNDGRDVFGREKNGGKIPLFMTLGRINDDEPRRYCAVLRDMTAWKRAEAQLTEARRAAEQASAKKSDFLAKISHEIRTPMNAIIGFAELMQEERLGAIGNAKYKEYLGDIRTSGQHVVSLVNDLLDLAKIEAGRMEMTFAATDINALVASSVGIIQPQANASRVLVRTQLAGKLPPVVADERSIRQIVLNMLSNATRYTEAGGQVIVATALTESGEAVIRIRDTGIGMSTGEIEQALEPFKQVGGTLRRQGGTGLGLPLTKALVEANRASFAIRSTPGEGTLVEITFPATRVLAE